MTGTTRGLTVLAMGFLAQVACAQDGRHPWSRWRHLPQDEAFFPFGVWAQAPRDAPAYQALGVDYYFGLHGGPTAEQIAEMRRHRMPFIATFNEYAQRNLLREPLAWGWMHLDEPDLAHVYPRDLLRGPRGKEILRDRWPEVYRRLDLDRNEYNGWGLGAHPVRDIQADYRRIRGLDPARPVFLQLSKAVAFEGRLRGRGDHSGNVEVYPEYIAGSDVVSFDVYPVADNHELWRVPHGLDQLRAWGAGDRPIMAIIEAGFGERYATHHQQRAQVWMAINHGASSITWFCHRWTGQGGSLRLVSTRMPLTQPEVGDAIRRIMAEVKAMAPVINSRPVEGIVHAEGMELDLATRSRDGARYIFAVERGGQAGEAAFRIDGVRAADVEVIGEDRTLRLEDGRFSDRFTPWEVHLYRVTARRPAP